MSQAKIDTESKEENEGPYRWSWKKAPNLEVFKIIIYRGALVTIMAWNQSPALASKAANDYHNERHEILH